MARLSGVVTRDGIHLDAFAMRELGARFGERVVLEVGPAPGADEIQAAALRHAWRKLGTSVGVRAPEWTGTEWVVHLWVRDFPEAQGQLVFDANGGLIADRSTSQRQLWEALGAESAVSPAA